MTTQSGAQSSGEESPAGSRGGVHSDALRAQHARLVDETMRAQRLVQEVFEQALQDSSARLNQFTDEAERLARWAATVASGALVLVGSAALTARLDGAANPAGRLPVDVAWPVVCWITSIGSALIALLFASLARLSATSLLETQRRQLRIMSARAEGLRLETPAVKDLLSGIKELMPQSEGVSRLKADAPKFLKWALVAGVVAIALTGLGALVFAIKLGLLDS